MKIVRGDKRGRPGKWLLDYRDAAGVRRIKTFDTKREAEDAAAEQTRERGRLKPTLSLDMTVGDLFERWIKLVEATDAKRRTREVYRALFTRYLSVFKDTQVRHLGRERIEEHLVSLLIEQRLSKTTVKMAHTLVTALLNEAVEKGLITSNPAKGLAKKLKLSKKTGQRQDEVRAFTREQAACFFTVAHRYYATTNYAPLLVVMVESGMRSGEALGLQWDDVDLDAKVFHIKRTLDDATQEEGTPKSGFGRTVDMSDDAHAALSRLLVMRKEQTLRHGWGKVPAWVFCDDEGRPIQAQNVRHVFHRILKKAGLPSHFSPHSLRHTFASILISEDGGLIEYVSRMLGHTSITITVSTYGRWLKPAGRAVNRLRLTQKMVTSGSNQPPSEGSNPSENEELARTAPASA